MGKDVVSNLRDLVFHSRENPTRIAILIKAIQDALGVTRANVAKLNVDVSHSIVHQVFPAEDAVASDDDALLESMGLVAEPAVQEVFLAQPHGRVITVKGNQASVAGNVLVTGTNLKGGVITESIALNGVAVVVGTKAFDTVTSVTLPALAQAGDAVAIGIGEGIGLIGCIPKNTIFVLLNGGVATTVKAGSTFSADKLEENVVILTEALKGAVVDIYYLTEVVPFVPVPAT
jgi:hypothetical protein